MKSVHQKHSLSGVHKSDFEFSYLRCKTSAPGVTLKDIALQQKSRRFWFLFFSGCWLGLEIDVRWTTGSSILKKLMMDFFFHLARNCDKLTVDLSQLQRKGVHATHFSFIQVYLTFLYVSTYIHRLMVHKVIHIKAFKSIKIQVETTSKAFTYKMCKDVICVLSNIHWPCGYIILFSNISFWTVQQ